MSLKCILDDLKIQKIEENYSNNSNLGQKTFTDTMRIKNFISNEN